MGRRPEAGSRILPAVHADQIQLVLITADAATSIAGHNVCPSLVHCHACMQKASLPVVILHTVICTLCGISDET